MSEGEKGLPEMCGAVVSSSGNSGQEKKRSRAVGTLIFFGEKGGRKAAIQRGTHLPASFPKGATRPRKRAVP